MTRSIIAGLANKTQAHVNMEYIEAAEKLVLGERLYSSGPGIYLHQLVSNVLGIRFGKDGLVIDPVLSGKLDGLRFNFTCFDRETTFVYHVAASRNGGIEAVRNGQALCWCSLLNPYRKEVSLSVRRNSSRKPEKSMFT